MVHTQVSTKIVGHTNGRERHQITDPIREWDHWSSWESEKIKAGIHPIDVTNQITVEGLDSQTSWKAFDEKLPSGEILRTIFIFQEPNWPTSDVTHP